MSTVRPLTDTDSARFSPSAYVTDQALREGQPEERELLHLASVDDRFSVGTWQAQPYAEYVENHAGYEYTRVLEGRVTLTSDDGTAHSFGPGDAFTIEPGWSGEYRVEEPLLKQYVFYSA